MLTVNETIFPDHMQGRLDGYVNGGRLKRDETTQANLVNHFFGYDEDERREAIKWMINQVGTQSAKYKVALTIIADRAAEAQEETTEALMPDPMSAEWVRELNNKSGGDMTQKAAASLVRHQPDLTNFSIENSDGKNDYDLLSVFLYQNDHKHVQRWVDEGGAFRAYELRRAARGAVFGTESLEVVLDHRPGRPKQLYKTLRSYVGRESTRGEPPVEDNERTVCELLEQAGMPYTEDDAVEDLPGPPRSVTGSILYVLGGNNGGRNDRVTSLRQALRMIIDQRVPIAEDGADFLYSMADDVHFENEPELVELTLEALLRQDHLPERTRLQELLNSEYADVVKKHTRGRKLKAARTGA